MPHRAQQRAEKPTLEIVTSPEMIVAGIPIQANWQQLWEEVPKAWGSLFARAAEFEKLSDGPFVDVSLGRSDVAYLQLVGFPLRHGVRVPDGLKAMHIPVQRLLHHRHVGDVKGIAASFGAMEAWAEQHALPPSEFKLDFGYTLAGDETAHDLYIGLRPETPWRHV